MTHHGPLGRVAPPDFDHVTKYPLTALDAAPTKVPVIAGTNWYEAFDRPERDAQGHYWVGRGDLGRTRGGHAYTLLPTGVHDPEAWWAWHDQISEGICVSVAVARTMALLNRKRFQPRPLYDVAQTIDEWPTEDYSGTSVRAGLDVARTQGLVPARRREPMRVLKGEITRPPDPADGIAANRWITSMDDLEQVLGHPGRGYVIFTNSWGRDYPRRVRMSLEVVDRLWREDGEYGVVTDR